MIAVTIGSLRAWGACSIDDRIAGLRAHLGRDVPDDEPVPLAVWAEVPWGGEPHHSDSDLRWALSRTSEGRRTLAALVADCVERVLPIWEARYPGDRRPREAVEAIRGWLRGEEGIERVRALAAAACAAWAAYDAADAAAYAAAAADAAASGAADADCAAWADADDDAADAADAAVAAAAAADADADDDAADAAVAAAAAAGDADDAAYVVACDAAERVWRRRRLLQYLRGEVAP